MNAQNEYQSRAPNAARTLNSNFCDFPSSSLYKTSKLSNEDILLNSRVFIRILVLIVNCNALCRNLTSLNIIWHLLKNAGRADRPTVNIGSHRLKTESSEPKGLGIEASAAQSFSLPWNTFLSTFGAPSSDKSLAVTLFFKIPRFSISPFTLHRTMSTGQCA